MDERQIGVEEELLLVDPDTGRPRAVAGAVLRRAAGEADDRGPGGVVEQELQQEQIETDTRPCASLDELGAEIRRWRAVAGEAARSAGAAVAALATSPLEVEPTTTPNPRYRKMRREFGLTAEEQLTCGLHVHVEVASDDEAVAALDRIQVWLPVLRALAANSPFWQGRDSGYASYRAQVWGRWPAAGPTAVFGSAAAYHETVDALVATGTLLDHGMVYFDARLARAYPTLELRVADVCLEAEDTVLIAALARGLVATAVDEAAQGTPPAGVRTEVLRVASWRAARSGTSGELVHPWTLRPAPAAQVVDDLMAHLRPRLEAAGDWDTAVELLARRRDRGGGAELQRAAWHRDGRLEDVVRDAVRRTVPA